ncbi:hypothetical protein GGR54DRAFT_652864 [Hypoxylon sp. NC1633]|nr:hypothetical protein GGR54DRAFT_652864 [Hypoxylon sp. NC1633]
MSSPVYAAQVNQPYNEASVFPQWLDPTSRGRWPSTLATEKLGLLGPTCRHVIMEAGGGNSDYVHHIHAPSRNVILLGNGAYTNLTGSIQHKIAPQGTSVNIYKRQIEDLLKQEEGNDKDNAGIEALGHFLLGVDAHWNKLENRVLGSVVRSPPIAYGVGVEGFTEDWAVFRVDKAKLGNGFQGNEIDLGTKMTPGEFTMKCFPRRDANWQFQFPADRLLQLRSIVSSSLMRRPDMWDSAGYPCFLVVKNGGATGTTLGRANGLFSIVREYFPTDMSLHKPRWEL